MPKTTLASLRRPRPHLAATALVLLLAGNASGEARLSAVVGEASVDGVPAAVRTTVDAGKSLVTGPESSCSVLVDKRSLVQVCGRASIRLRDDEQRKTKVVALEGGSMRAVVSPRTPGDALEIQTPLAVAEILGTVIDTAVNEATGTVIYALEEGSARITLNDAAGTQVMLQAGQQVTLRPGEPPVVEPIRMELLMKEVECLDELREDAPVRPLRIVPLQADRKKSLDTSLDRIARADIPTTTPGPVGSGPQERRPIFPLGPNDPLRGAAPPRDNECLVNCDPNVLNEIFPPVDETGGGSGGPPLIPTPTGFRQPPPCANLPGTFCGFTPSP